VKPIQETDPAAISGRLDLPKKKTSERERKREREGGAEISGRQLPLWEHQIIPLSPELKICS
jgi:hypothetical protein